MTLLFSLLEELQKVLFEQIDLRRRLEQEFQVLKGNTSFPVFSKKSLLFHCIISDDISIIRLKDMPLNIKWLYKGPRGLPVV